MRRPNMTQHDTTRHNTTRHDTTRHASDCDSTDSKGRSKDLKEWLRDALHVFFFISAFLVKLLIERYPIFEFFTSILNQLSIKGFRCFLDLYSSLWSFRIYLFIFFQFFIFSLLISLKTCWSNYPPNKNFPFSILFPSSFSSSAKEELRGQWRLNRL